MLQRPVKAAVRYLTASCDCILKRDLRSKSRDGDCQQNSETSRTIRPADAFTNWLSVISEPVGAGFLEGK
jgi:hypothetical protein